MAPPKTPLEKVNERIRGALPFGGDAPRAQPAPGGGVTRDPTATLLADAINSGGAFVGDDGLVNYYDPVSGDWIQFTKNANGQYVVYNPPEKPAGGGAGDGVGYANVGLGYAQLGENARQFDVSTANQVDQFNRDFAEGQRQFDANFSESQFRDRRDFEEQRAQFAQSFAETQREFDLNYGLDTRRVGVEEGRLSLDTELGRGRLGLDTELGRRAAAVNEGQLDVNRGQLKLNRQLGFASAKTEAARLGQEGAIANRSQRLDEQRFRAEVLRNPSDYVFRAFQSRGETAPTAQVSQAQLLNSLRDNSPVPMEKGGRTKARLILAGEKGPELIYRHEDGSLSIADSKTTKSLLTGGREETVQTRFGEAKRYAAGTDDKFFQELAKLRTYESGNDPVFNQQELVQAARDYSPPEVTSAIEGTRLGTYRPVTSGITLRRLGRLTPGGLQAANTRLGVEFNTTLEDELAGLQERFLGTRSTPLARLAS